MKKRIYIILSMITALYLLTGCSGAGGSEAASGELTFKQALERPGVHVWYDVNSLSDGRFAKVRAAFVFEDGKVIVYDTGDINDKIPDALGTLEDYYSLSEEDAAALVREKYRSGYEAYYALLEDRLNKFREDTKDYAGYPNPEEQEQALVETYETLTAEPLPEKEPQVYGFAMTADQSGNKTAAEGFHAFVMQDDTYSGMIGSSASGYELYKIQEGQAIEKYFPAQETLRNVQIYDTWYGGYNADYHELFGNGSLHYLVTKCNEDTVFLLDEPGTEGIEIIG